MVNYKTIDDAIYEVAAEQIGKQQINPTVSLILLTSGVAMMASAHFVEIIRASTLLANTTFLAGALVAAVGLVKGIVDFTKRRKLYYKPNGSELRRYELLFDTPYLMKVRECVNDGDMASLAGIPHSDSSPVKAVIYKTEDDDVMMTQAFQYKKPLTETKFFSKGSFTFADSLAVR